MLIIKNGLMFDVVNKKMEVFDIAINGKKIANIEKNILQGADDVVIDAMEKFITPGIIDAHTHLGLDGDSVGFERQDYNESTDPVTPQMRAIDGFNPFDTTVREALEGGITCVATGPGSANVLGGSFAVLKTYGTRVDKMIVKAPVAMKCAFCENPRRFYNNKGKTPVTRMGIAALLRENLQKAVEYNEKIIAANGDKTLYPAFDAKLNALLPVVRKEIPLKAHAHSADDICTAIRIAKEFDVKLTLDHCTDGTLILDELLEENYPVIVGPTLGHRTKVELVNKSYENVAKIGNSGLLFAITTDSPVIPLHYLPLSAGLAVKAGLDKWKALQAITINPAKILGLEDRVGSLEIGKDADIVIWDADPLMSSANVLKTIIDGKIVYSKE
jgi:imidazolonepropionase-like amidohydrolase